MSNVTCNMQPCPVHHRLGVPCNLAWYIALIFFYWPKKEKQILHWSFFIGQKKRKNIALTFFDWTKKEKKYCIDLFLLDKKREKILHWSFFIGQKKKEKNIALTFFLLAKNREKKILHGSWQSCTLPFPLSLSLWLTGILSNFFQVKSFSIENFLFDILF